MKFEKSLHIFTNLTLLAGASALLASYSVSRGFVGICLGAVLVSLFFPVELGSRLQSALFAGFVALFVVDALYLSGYVTASIHLVLLVGFLKAWTGRSDRDYLLVLSSSFTMVLVAASGSLSPAFLAVLVAFVFFSVVSLLHFENRKAYGESPQVPFQVSSYLVAGALISLLIAFLAIPIFVSVPRARLGLWSVRGGPGGLVTGFSDHVALGDIGRILNNRRVFMRIKLSVPIDQIPSTLKWRGVILNHYDGNAWSSTPRTGRYIDRSALRPGFLVSETRRQNEKLLTQMITRELPGRIIFGADNMVWVAGLGEDGRIRSDHNGSLFFSRTRPRSFSYRVDSDLIGREARLSGATSAEIPESLKKRYLQLPSIDPEVVELTRATAGPNPDAVRRALRLEGFLRENYAYSLDNLSAASTDPLAHFLLVGRSGHCEYYATALAVMLRIEGIPSRVVNGFHRGAVNVWSENLIVRQSDAHSWVEAYFPGAGWVELDATPALPRYDDGIFFLAVQVGDAIELFWNQLVSFDRISQLSLLVAGLQEIRQAVAAVAGLVESVRRETSRLALALFSRPWEVVILVFAAGVLWLVLRPLWRSTLSWWARLSWPESGRLSTQAKACYHRLEGILKKRGLSRLRAETPLEFAERAGLSLESGIPSEITALYYHARFGGCALTPDQLRSIEEGLAELK